MRVTAGFGFLTEFSIIKVSVTTQIRVPRFRTYVPLTCDIFTSSISTVPPWLLKRPLVDLSLSSFAKAETIPAVFKSKFLEICDRLQVFGQTYTDGSKTNNGTAAAAVSGDVVKSLRITSHDSIFTAELVALNLALDIIRRSRHKKFVLL